MAGSRTRNRDPSSVVSRNLRSTPKGKSDRLGGRHSSSHGEEDGRHISTARNNTTGSGDDDSSQGRSRRKLKDRDRRAARRKMDSEMDLALLSDDNDDHDGDDASHAVERKRPSRLVPSNPAVTEGLSPTLSGASVNDRHHQQGDAVEARFGGRSKWFTGKVSARI